jgi:hypothetical protein
MTNAEMNMKIVNLHKWKADQAHHEWVSALIAYEREQVSFNVWQREYDKDDDHGINGDHNPYNPQHASERLGEARLEWDTWVLVYDHVVRTFVTKETDNG